MTFTDGTFETLFRFIEHCEEASNLNELVSSLHKVITPLGLSSVIVTGLPLPQRSIEPLILLCSWPKEWLHRYIQENYFSIDPVAQHALVNGSPFDWRSALSKAESKQAKAFVDESASFGLRNGYCVPINTATTWQALVSFASSCELELSSRYATVINFLSITLYRHAKFLMGETKLKSYQLTAREREVLTWVAAGKSAWEIGCILTMAEKTVIHHLDHIRRKLDVANTTQAVAVAIQTGELELC